MQICFIKHFAGMKNLHHVQRIQKLKLPGLVYRKTRGGMRETYEIVHCNSKKKEKKKNGTVRQKSRFLLRSSHCAMNCLKRVRSILPCQTPDIIGSLLGLVGPVSVYCDGVRWKVLICKFYLGVAARKIVWADPSLRYIRMLLGR